MATNQQPKLQNLDFEKAAETGHINLTNETEGRSVKSTTSSPKKVGHIESGDVSAARLKLVH